MNSLLKLPIISALTIALLCGCQTTSKIDVSKEVAQSVASLYDYTLLSPNGNEVSIAQLVADNADVDVFMVGEFHAHPGVHLFQAQLMAHLAYLEKPLALSMEQFTRADQDVLSQYVTGKVGESTLIKHTKVWDNYKSDYRPLVEIARKQSLPVIAANAPRNIVKCIGRQGPEYVEKLSNEQRQLIAQNIDISDSPYRQKFLSNMRGMTLTDARIAQMFGAQMAWDATMAESMANYLNQFPEHRIMHIAGRFHVLNGLGTGAELKKRRAQTSFINISAVTESEKTNISDYRLVIQPLPPMWVNKEERAIVMGGHKRSNITCL